MLTQFSQNQGTNKLCKAKRACSLHYIEIAYQISEAKDMSVAYTDQRETVSEIRKLVHIK